MSLTVSLFMLMVSIILLILFLWLPGWRWWSLYDLDPLDKLALAPLPVLFFYAIASWSAPIVTKVISYVYPVIGASTYHGLFSPWLWLSVLVSISVIAGAKLIYRIVDAGARAIGILPGLQRWDMPVGSLRPSKKQDKISLRWLPLVMVLSAVIGVLPWLLASEALVFPVLHQDAFFHYAVTNHALSDGSIGMFGATAVVQNTAFQHAFYPALLYTVTAPLAGWINIGLSALGAVGLADFLGFDANQLTHFGIGAGPGAVLAVQTVMLMLAGIWSIAVITALAKHLLPGKVYFATPFLAVSTAAFPSFQIFLHGQFPYALGITLALVAILVAVLELGRAKIILLPASVLVAGSAHTSALIIILVVGFVYIWVRGWERLQNRNNIKIYILWLIIALLVMMAATLVAYELRSHGFVSYARPVEGAWERLQFLLSWAPPVTYEAGILLGNPIVSLIYLVGFGLFIRKLWYQEQITLRQHTWYKTWVLASLGFAVLVVIAAAQNRFWQSVTLPFYYDPDRLQAVFHAFNPLVLTAGLWMLGYVVRLGWQHLRAACLPKSSDQYYRLWKKPLQLSAVLVFFLQLAVLIVATRSFGLYERLAFVYGGQHPEHGLSQPIATVEKNAGLLRLGASITAQDTVLVDPLEGGLLLQAYSRAKVVPKILSITNYAPVEMQLFAAVFSINEPQSATLLREHKVNFVLSESNEGTVYGPTWLSTQKIIAQVGAGDKLVFVGRAGSATLWALEL